MGTTRLQEHRRARNHRPVLAPVHEDPARHQPVRPRDEDVRQGAKRALLPHGRHHESLLVDRQPARHERLLCRDPLPYLII